MNLKLLFYPAAIVTVVFLSLFVVLQRWQIVISIEPLDLQPTSLIEPEPVPTSTSAVLPITAKSVTNQPKQTPTSAPPGVLRLSNKTEHPLRIAFLARQQGAKSNKQPVYGEPAHWDFEPDEGGSNGLILSLPTGFVKLEKGDILIAFAQDGSRRYWGPYVVGETPQPVWNKQKSEWLLILQP